MAETRPNLTDEYLEQVQKALDEMMGKITNPQEPTKLAQDDNKTTVQRAEEELENKKDQSISNLENSNCCCMLEEWIIEEKDRKFKLEVVKEEKEIIPLQESKNNNPRAYKENYHKNNSKYVLYVVTSPASPNGNVTYKEITTNHKFKKKNCDLKILAKKGNQELYLKEGEVLKIDSNGDIISQCDMKYGINGYAEPIPNYTPVDIPTPKGMRIREYEDRPRTMCSKPIYKKIPENPYDIPSYYRIPPYKYIEKYTVAIKQKKKSKEDKPKTLMEKAFDFEETNLLKDSLFDTLENAEGVESIPVYADIQNPNHAKCSFESPPVGQQTVGYEDVPFESTSHYVDNHVTRDSDEMESYPIFESIDADDRNSLVVLLKTLIYPPSIIGNKIVLQAKGSSKCKPLKIHIYPVEHLEVDLEISMDFHMNSYVNTNPRELGRAKKKAEFEVLDKYSKITAKGTIKRGTTSIEFAKEQESEVKKQVARVEAKEFFRGIKKPMSSFYSFFEKAERLSQEKKLSRKKTASFGPGKTNITAKFTGLKIVENQKDYSIDWEGKVELSFGLFNGAKHEVDLIAFIISRGKDKNNSISNLIKYIRIKLKRGFNTENIRVAATIEANLVLSGSVSATVSWEKKANEDTTPDGEAKGGVGFALETKLEIEGRYYEIKGKAGAEFKSTSEKDNNAPSEFVASMKATKGKTGGMDWTGDLMFTGLTLYWAIYGEVKRDKNIETRDVNNTRSYEETIPSIESPKFTEEDSINCIKECSIWNHAFNKSSPLDNSKKPKYNPKFHPSGVPRYLLH